MVRTHGYTRKTTLQNDDTNTRKSDTFWRFASWIRKAEILAKKAKEKKIDKVYFDRGEHKYHGRIKAFAESLRKNGLKF